MNYDEELEYLRKEFKKSEAKFHEAEREGWHTDVNIYKDNMANLEYQIHIHEQAAKADEYEKNRYRTHVNDYKAKAFDAILKAYDEAFSREHMAGEVSNIIEKYESGESE